MPPDKRRIDVMVSSTTKDLGEHRRRVGEIISRFKLVPRIMDLDSTTGKDGVTYSLDLVDEAEIYILLIGFRYGHIPDDPRNPDKVSITEMEYRRALEREKRGELCVLPFVMADDHPLLHDHIEIDPEKRAKLDKFRAAVTGKQISFFSSVDDLEKQVSQSLAMSECVLHVKFKSYDWIESGTNSLQGMHRQADLRLLSELWYMIEISKILRVVNGIEQRNLTFEDYESSIDQYYYMRKTQPQSQFINPDLESAFKTFDDKLGMYIDQIGHEEQLMTIGNVRMLVPRYKVSEIQGSYLSDESYQRLSAENDKTIQMGFDLLHDYEKLVKSIKLLMPEFDFLRDAKQ